MRRWPGNIGVFELDPKALTSRYRNAAFFASTEALPIALGRVTGISQGFVEASNVNPVKELANLIAITRNFESATAIVDRADRAISKSVNDISGA